MKKKNIIDPQYIKNHQGKITQVYLSIDGYEELNRRLKKWEKIQKTEGVHWVQISQEKHKVKKANKKK